MPSLQASPQSNGADEEIDLSEIIRTIRRQWRKIALITIICGLIAIFHVLFSKPQFTVDGSLYLGDAQTGSGAAQAISSSLSFLSDFQSTSDVETQVDLIQAKAQLERSILETGLNSPVSRGEGGNLLFWSWKLFYGKSITAFAPRPGDIKASYATLAEPRSGPIVFKIEFGDGGSFRIVRGGGWYSSPGTVLSGTIGQPASGGGLSLVIKPAIAGQIPKAGSRFTLTVTPASAMAEGMLTNGALFVSAGGTVTAPTKLANIEFHSLNPYDGQLFVNQLMDDFIATQLAWTTESASVTQDFIANQLSKIQFSLDSADKKLAAYQAQTGILDVPENAKAVIEQLSQYEVQQETVQLQREALQQLANEIAHPSGSLNPYLVSQTDDVTLGQLSGKLADAEANLQSLGVQFTRNSTQFAIQEATVSKLEDAIRSMIGNDLILASTNLSNINVIISKYETQLKSMPADSLQVVALTRSSQVYGSLYILLMEKEEEAEVSKAATIINTRVASPAELPLSASKPKATGTVALGILIGLFVGVALVLAQRALSGRFQSDEEIRRVAPLPVYGMIPRRSRAEATSSIFSNRPQSPFAEAFRLLRSNLYQSASAHRSRVILITSATSSDGKTTCASNLAKILADDGKRVILVDGDLHRGRVHEALKVNQAPGLVEWLVTTVEPKFQLPPDQSFSVLPTGVFPPNPSELLNESFFGEIINALRGEFEFVIVDCPPLPAVADTMALAQHADLILSVVHIAHTLRGGFAVHNETLGTLERRRGLIINGVTNSAYGYGYGYGYGDRERALPLTTVEKIRFIVVTLLKKIW